jgi:hypothetical protein
MKEMKKEILYYFEDVLRSNAWLMKEILNFDQNG